MSHGSVASIQHATGRHKSRSDEAMIESVSVLTARHTVWRDYCAILVFGLGMSSQEELMSAQYSVVDRMQDRIDGWERSGDPRRGLPELLRADDTEHARRGGRR